MSDGPTLFDVLVRQRESWQSGQRLLVENILETCPHLVGDRESLLDLVYNEYLLREEFGPVAPAADYARRFPHLADELRVQFEVDEALTVEDANPVVNSGATVFAPGRSGEREPLPRLEGCDLLGELGKGAMGVVYRGWQRGARRPVAVKVLSADVPPGRVRTEAEAASRLLHPHIVQVFEVKQLGEQTALVLEYVEGGNLAQKLGGKPQPPRDCARLVETLAWAMAYAHGRGVVHRDLKPSNILLSGKADARLSQTAPKIGDFGLAKLLEGVEPGLTRTNDVLGTPSYMAPEQTGIAGEPAGPAADVYSLGAILYECLTGRPPFLGHNVLDTLDQVRHAEPVPPSVLQPRVPRDLEVVCLKCLEKSPGRRFASARELAEDLRRFQNNESIRARSVGPLERTVKLARRRPVGASLAAVAAAVAVALVVGGVAFNRALREQRDIARRQADDLDTQLTRTRQLLYTAQLLRVGSVWESDPAQGLGMLEDPRACPPDLRCFSWRVLHSRCHGFRESVSTAVEVTALASSAAAVAWGGPGGQVYLRETGSPDLAERQALPLPGQSARVVALAFSRDGKWLASAADNGRIVVWAVPGGKFSARIDLPGQVAGLAWQQGGKVLAVNSGKGASGSLRLVDVRPGQPQRTLADGTSLQSGLAVSPDGHAVACAGVDHAVRLWDTRTGRLQTTLRGHTSAVRCLIFASAGRRLVSGDGDGMVRVWDPLREIEQEQFAVAAGPVRALSVDAGQTLAVVSEGLADSRLPSTAGRPDVVADVQLWDLVTRQSGAPLRGHPGGAVGAEFSPDGHTLVTAGLDGTVKFWDHPGRREQLPLRGHVGNANSVALARDGRTVAWVTRGDRPGAHGQEISVYDLEKSASAGVIRLRGRPVQCLALHPQGNLVASATGSDDEPAEVLVWEVRTGRLVQALSGHSPGVVGLAFGHDGRSLVSASRDGAVKSWDVDSAKLLWERAAGATPLRALATSPDGAVGVVGGPDGRAGQLVVWSSEGVRQWQRPTPTAGHCLALSGGGSCAAWAGADGLVRLVAVGEEGDREPLSAGMKGVASLAFSPDGKTLAVAGSGTGVKLWDVGTVQERASLPGHRGGACFVAFSADGDLLLSAGVSQTARLWYARPAPRR